MLFVYVVHVCFFMYRSCTNGECSDDFVSASHFFFLFSIRCLCFWSVKLYFHFGSHTQKWKLLNRKKYRTNTKNKHEWGMTHTRSISDLLLFILNILIEIHLHLNRTNGVPMKIESEKRDNKKMSYSTLQLIFYLRTSIYLVQTLSFTNFSYSKYEIEMEMQQNVRLSRTQNGKFSYLCTQRTFN